MMGELVPTLRRFAELDVSDETAARLVTMSAATIDRRLAPDRAKLRIRDRSHTKPGSLTRRFPRIFARHSEPGRRALRR